VGKGNKPATMALTVPVLRVLQACRGQRAAGLLIVRPMSGQPIDRLPHGRPDREGCWNFAAHQSPLAAPRSDHQRPGRRRPAPRRPDPRPPRRPRTTEHYDRARGNLDRHGVHFLTAYFAGV
jgi:integrase/recombinase XerD